jgi:hypothetical protein
MLWEAATKSCDARGIVMKIIESFGDAMSSVGAHAADALKDKFGIDVSGKVQEITQDLLWSFQTGSMVGLDANGSGDRWEWYHKALVIASGASGGFVGLPGLLWDIPITTGTIMRSVADIARSFPGEDIGSDDTKRACIEVFALGGPLSDDDEADLGYWATRAGLGHATIEIAIKAVAARFSIVITEKMLAQTVPIVGAVAGAALNYAFIDYYQEMARVQFMVRGVERRAPDPSAVRPCFTAIVRAVQASRRVGGAKVGGEPLTGIVSVAQAAISGGRESISLPSSK